MSVYQCIVTGDGEVLISASKLSPSLASGGAGMHTMVVEYELKANPIRQRMTFQGLGFGPYTLWRYRLRPGSF